MLFFCLGLPCAQADVTTIIQTGVWTDNHPQNDTDYLLPLSATVKTDGLVADTDLRYQLDVRTGTHDFFQDEQLATVREATLELPLAGGDLTLGRLLLPWGRADQINPTNSLVTRDYQWRTTTDDEQKSGNDGIAWRRDFNDWSVTSVWLPQMRSSRLPWIEALKNTHEDEPDDHRNIALRVDHTGQQMDYGISLYQGMDVMPSLRAVVGAAPNLSWTNYRIRRAGFDAAINLGTSTLRAELAQTTVLSNHRDNGAVLHGQPADDVQLVLGMDRDLTENLNLNVQWLGQWITGDYPPINQQPAALQTLLATQRLVNQQPEKNLYGMSWRLRQTLWQDTLAFELAGIAYGDGQGSLWRPRIQYQLDDHNSFTLGGDRFFGSKDAMYGVLQDDSVWFMQWQLAY